jgi:hypothetical protein
MLHDGWRQNDFIGVSARLRAAVVREHDERAGDRACQELVATTSSWGVMGPAKFKAAIAALIQRLIASAGCDSSMRRRRDRSFEIPDGLTAVLPHGIEDSTAYRMARWFGLTPRDLNGRVVRDHLRHELRRPHNSFDSLWSRLATLKDLTVEKVVNAIAEIEPPQPYPYEIMQVGEVVFSNLKYSRHLAVDSSFMPSLRKLFPFTVADGKVMKTVCGREVNVFWLRVFNDFDVSEATLAAVEKRMAPFDWTSASIKSAIAAVTAEAAAKDKKADPTPETKLDSKQDENLLAWEKLTVDIETAQAAGDMEKVALLLKKRDAMEDLSQWEDKSASGEVTLYPNNPLVLSRTKIIQDARLKARDNIVDFDISKVEGLVPDEGGQLCSHKPAKSTATASDIEKARNEK